MMNALHPRNAHKPWLRAECASCMEEWLISADLTVLRLITHVLEPLLNVRLAAFVSLGVTADVCHVKPVPH